MSPEQVRAIILAFAEVDFFSLRGSPCVYYVTKNPQPRALPTRQSRLGLQEFSEAEASITVGGRSHSVQYSYQYGQQQSCGDDPDAVEALNYLGRVLHDAVNTAMESTPAPGTAVPTPISPAPSITPAKSSRIFPQDPVRRGE